MRVSRVITKEKRRRVYRVGEGEVGGGGGGGRRMGLSGSEKGVVG